MSRALPTAPLLKFAEMVSYGVGLLGSLMTSPHSGARLSDRSEQEKPANTTLTSRTPASGLPG